jgi:hypothetical protein
MNPNLNGVKMLKRNMAFNEKRKRKSLKKKNSKKKPKLLVQKNKYQMQRNQKKLPHKIPDK